MARYTFREGVFMTRYILERGYLWRGTHLVRGIYGKEYIKGGNIYGEVYI
jgi:hypothetical protein